MKLLFGCRDATRLLTDDAENALSGVEKAQFALHLKVCGPCQRYRAQFDLAVEALKNLPRATPNPTDVDAIIDLLTADKS